MRTRLLLLFMALGAGGLLLGGLGAAPGSRAAARPAGAITWGPARDMANYATANEPAAALHPSDPLRALSVGNGDTQITAVSINTTSDGGATWARFRDSLAATGADGAVTWLPADAYGGLGGLAAFLGITSEHILQLDKTTDGGATWTRLTTSNIHTPGFTDDR